MKGKTAECANLIRSGANVNTCDLNEICPLAAAATTGSVETVELLIKMKAIIDFKDRTGHTPLIKVIICVFVLVLVCVGILRVLKTQGLVPIMLQMKFLTACQ